MVSRTQPPALAALEFETQYCARVLKGEGSWVLRFTQKQKHRVNANTNTAL